MDELKTPNDPLTAPGTKLDMGEIREKLASKKGKAYWRSLEELAETPEFDEFMQKEFPRQAAPMVNGVDRRDFMKLLGASLALAGLTSCVRPYRQEKIVPYVKAPEELIPGVPVHYASALTQGGFAKGVLVENHQGRPTKIEGNPDHPASLGTTDAIMQAATLALYDPDRAQITINSGNPSTYTDFVETLTGTLGGIGDGAGLHILTETITSPVMAEQLAQVLRTYPQAQWHQFDPAYSDGVRQGAQLAFGEDVQTRYDFSQANVVLSLSADFLGTGEGKLNYTKGFSQKRRVRSAEDDMNRVYVAESTPSITGSMADHRLALNTRQIEQLARAVASQLGVSVGEASAPEGVPAEWVSALVEDLQGAQGSSVVVAGDEQSPLVHALAHAMNNALGNVGQTVMYTDPVVVRTDNQLESMRTLTDAMAAGEVQALLMIDGNPVYNAPADLNFAEALSRVPLSVHLAPYYDETSVRSTWHVPITHELEMWSDARAFDGTVTIIQPLIAPFYNGVSPHEFLSAVLGQPDTAGYDIVRSFYQERAEGNFDVFWRDAMYRGVLQGTAAQPKEVSIQGDFSGQSARAGGEGLEVTFRLDPSVYDGRYANIGWLQELPNPFTKLTWDNAAFISPALAEQRGLSNQDVVTLTFEGRSVRAPIWIMPGQAENVVTLHLGYGRENVGHIGNGTGFNAYLLRTTGTPWNGQGLQMEPTEERYQLVSTQMHHALFEDGVEARHIVRHGTLAELKAHPEHPEFVHPVEHHDYDLYSDYSYPDHAWGMVVDMNTCTGCNACVTACQAENNIPIVGKQQVAVGREMQWIRVDSYYGGSFDEPEFYHQPMMCQHCEQAPCEPVCPVGATVHDHEGLNVMVYNRCVGTRYCSNNCPYKVRRFNFLQYAELEETSLSMLQNPNVTVRSRGVMEKCTYCIQRIKTGTLNASNENREIQDGDVVVACQSACPAEAIIFGDINDLESQVAKDKASVLNYGVLTELNTVPRTTYLAKVKNPNPALVSAESGAH